MENFIKPYTNYKFGPNKSSPNYRDVHPTQGNHKFIIQYDIA